MAITIYPPVFSNVGAYRASTYLSKITFKLDSRSSFDDYKWETIYEDGTKQGYIQCILKNNQGNSILNNSNGYIFKAPYKKDEEENSITIEFSSEDFKTNFFNLDYINQSIKLDINLFGAAAQDKSQGASIQSWLQGNQNYIFNGSGNVMIPIISDFNNFLINNNKDAILIPTNLSDEGFEDKTNYIFTESLSNPITLSSDELAKFSTSLIFTNSLETDILTNYRLRYYNAELDGNLSLGTLIYDSRMKKISSNNISQVITKTLPKAGAWIYIQLDIVTNKGFQGSFSRAIQIMENTVGETNKTVEVIALEDLGANKINFFANDGVSEKLILRRASYLTNFTEWEEIYTYSETKSEGIYYDFTIESGTAYKYQVQGYSGSIRKAPSEASPAVICLFDHESLIAEGIPLNLYFDSKITGYKRIIPESKIETIGSRYPFIRRNGNVNYKQFTLSGLISILGDEQEIFIKKLALRKDSSSLYDEYNAKKAINNYNDFVLEREFRNEVLNFLHKDTVKLFRSLPEGNMLVKLMDIQLTANETLGRQIYSFSCTAYEIAEATIENMKKYNVIGDPIEINLDLISLDSSSSIMKHDI